MAYNYDYDFRSNNIIPEGYYYCRAKFQEDEFEIIAYFCDGKFNIPNTYKIIEVINKVPEVNAHNMAIDIMLKIMEKDNIDEIKNMAKRALILLEK